MLRTGTFYKQNDINYVLMNDTDVYYQNLDHIYQNIENDINAQFLYFAYVSLASSTLEASLNHVLYTHFINLFGPENYKRYSESFINIGFSNKLYITPTIISNSKFQFNKESSTIKKLEELITLRNRILHKKPSLQKVDYDINDLEAEMKIELKNFNHIESINKNHCMHFNKAMMCFKEDFMTPYFENKLKENSLIKKV